MKNEINLYLKQYKEIYDRRIILNDNIKPSYPNLSIFYDKIKNCTKCSLSKSRTKLVFGVGNPNAEIVIVGEAPGKNEDLIGEPFVGRGGKLLDKILGAINLNRKGEYYDLFSRVSNTFICICVINVNDGNCSIYIMGSIKWII